MRQGLPLRHDSRGFVVGARGDGVDRLVGYVRDQVRPALDGVGGFVRMCVLTGKALFRPPFQWREFILQSWFLMRVAFLPTLAVSIR